MGFGLGQFYLQKSYQQQVEASYRRAFREFATHMEGLEQQLNVARIASTPNQIHNIAANIRSYVYAAQANMGQLPLGEVDLSKIEQVIAGVYERTFVYESGILSPEQMDDYYEQVKYLNQEVQSLLASKDVESPLVSWGKYFSTSVVFSDGLVSALTAINAGLDEFGELASIPRQPRGEIVGAEITTEQAVDIARSFSGKKELDFTVVNRSEGDIPSYTVEGQEGSNQGMITVEVSMRGGLVLWMMNSRPVAQGELSVRQMSDRAAAFLQERGFPRVHMTDYQVLQNRATLTFVPVRDGILRYAEPLKVQVSAADGEILGFQGLLYYLAQNREQQTLETESPLVDGERARHEISKMGSIQDQRMAAIMNDQQQEVLTHRFGIKHDEDYFLVYVNAETGEEERIVPVASGDYF